MIRLSASTAVNSTRSQRISFDNTFAMLVRGEDARRYSLKRFRCGAVRRSGNRIGHDFVVRPDSYRAFKMPECGSPGSTRCLDLPIRHWRRARLI